MTSFYKIRNSKGMFSTGGCRPRFSKAGKVWTNRAHVVLHLAQFTGKYGYRSPYAEGCEVVEYEMREWGSESVQDVLGEMEEKKAAEEKSREARVQRGIEKRERSLLKSLRDKYPEE